MNEYAHVLADAPRILVATLAVVSVYRTLDDIFMACTTPSSAAATTTSTGHQRQRRRASASDEPGADEPAAAVAVPSTWRACGHPLLVNRARLRRGLAFDYALVFVATILVFTGVLSESGWIAAVALAMARVLPAERALEPTRTRATLEQALAELDRAYAALAPASRARLAGYACAATRTVALGTSCACGPHETIDVLIGFFVTNATSLATVAARPLPRFERALAAHASARCVELPRLRT